MTRNSDFIYLSWVAAEVTIKLWDVFEKLFEPKITSLFA